MSRSMRWCRSGEMSTNKMHFGIEKQYGTNNYKLWSMTFTMNPVKSPATDNPCPVSSFNPTQ